MDRTGEAERLQHRQEGSTEATAVGEPIQFRSGESQVFQIVERLFQSGGDQEVTFRGQAADEQLEYSGFPHLFGVVRLQHSELIQVGQ